MTTSKRDLLVLSRKVSDDPEQLMEEVEILNAILFAIETTKNLCICCEVIDVNNYRIIQKQSKVEKIVNQKDLKAFQFLFNKN